MSGQATTLRVIKLGGSLLGDANLRTRLRDWLAQQSPATNVVLVGGGQLVDVLRDLGRRHGLGDETCHWLAIRAMGLTARVVQAMLPESRLVSRLETATLGPDDLVLFDPGDFLQHDESLPHSWDVTSDSIAAQLVRHLGAEELVLIKSSLPTVETMTEAARCGYVDQHFPQAAAGLRVRCVDLRDEEFAERKLE